MSQPGSFYALQAWRTMPEQAEINALAAELAPLFAERFPGVTVITEAMVDELIAELEASETPGLP